MNGLPRNRWSALIAIGVAVAQEVGQEANAVPDLVEWFGEWSRDARGEQRGLLLLTAHRAKGLEFDDVVILDGGWDRVAERRCRRPAPSVLCRHDARAADINLGASD